MKLTRTVQRLTLYSCAVALVMSGFSLRLGAFHITKSKFGFAWGVAELVTTGTLIPLVIWLFAVVWLEQDRTKLCLVLAFASAVLSCIALPNQLSSVILLASFAGWVKVVDHEYATGKRLAAKLSPRPLLLPSAALRKLPKRLSKPIRCAKLANYLNSFVGFFGLTIVLSVLGFVLKVLEMNNAPMEIRIAKGSATAFELCLLMCVLPVVERVLPYMVWAFCFLPKRWRIKDKHLHRRIVDLGNIYAVIHVLAHFSYYMNPITCNFQLSCIVPFALAWVSGYGLVWVFVLMYALAVSPELKQQFYRFHRMGHVSFTLLFLLHRPEIGYWLVAIVFLMALDAVMRWKFLVEAKILVAETLSSTGGFSHLAVATRKTDKLMVGMVNIQILSVGKQFKPFTVFRLPGEQPSVFHCIIKTHEGGWTQDLEYAIETNQVRAHTQVCVDGPHATLSDKHKDFTKLLLLASGVGITVVLSVLGTANPRQVDFIRLEWGLRMGELRAFLPVFRFLSNWKRISFPHLEIQINVSGTAAGEDSNLTWLRDLSVSKEHGDVALFTICEGRTKLDKVFQDTKQRVVLGRVGVFGCGSNAYCRTVTSTAGKYFADRVSFHCSMESV